LGLILVVDDDAGIRESVRRILDAEGHAVLTADDGCQGVLLTRREQPDIVLTDLNIPGLDGQSVCEVLREDPRTSATRIIAMSAGATLSEIAPGLLADTVMAKPFSAHLLVANINLQLQKRARVH
jgi:DNA-binding response OmpR family regulator